MDPNYTGNPLEHGVDYACQSRGIFGVELTQPRTIRPRDKAVIAPLLPQKTLDVLVIENGEECAEYCRFNAQLAENVVDDAYVVTKKFGHLNSGERQSAGGGGTRGRRSVKLLSVVAPTWVRDALSCEHVIAAACVSCCGRCCGQFTSRCVALLIVARWIPACVTPTNLPT